MLYDVLIVGGGPAGITAGIYAKRAGRNVAIIEKYAPGGQLNFIGKIENYPGFEEIEGSDLAMKFDAHARKIGVPFIYDEVIDYDFSGKEKTVMGKKSKYLAKTIILALGCHTKELNIEGEKEFKGRGVSYCAVCDGAFFKGKTVAVVGSGDSAFSDAEYLTGVADHVYLLTKDHLKVHNYSAQAFDENPKVTILKGALSTKIEGKDAVEKLYYKQDGKDLSIDVDAVFVAIGRKPDTSKLEGNLKLTENGYIITDDKMQASVEGVFAIGDVRDGTIRQIATAVGDGALAGTEAMKKSLVWHLQ